MDFEGVMGGFGRKTCEKGKGMEDHIEEGMFTGYGRVRQL